MAVPIKVMRRARAIKGVAENQKSEGAPLLLALLMGLSSKFLSRSAPSPLSDIRAAIASKHTV
jgi:hypothetical protein